MAARMTMHQGELLEALVGLGRLAAEAAELAPDSEELHREAIAAWHALHGYGRHFPAQSGIHLLMPGPDDFSDFLVAIGAGNVVAASSIMQTTLARHLHEELLHVLGAQGVAYLGVQFDAPEESFVALARLFTPAESGRDRAIEAAFRAAAAEHGAFAQRVRRECPGLYAMASTEVLPVCGPWESWACRVGLTRVVQEIEERGPDADHLPEWLNDGHGIRLARQVLFGLGGNKLVVEAVFSAAELDVPGGYDNLLDALVPYLPQKAVAMALQRALQIVGSVKSAQEGAEDGDVAPLERDAARRVARTVVWHLYRTKHPQGAEFLMALAERGLVARETLPRELRRQLEIRDTTERFAADPARALARLEEAPDDAAFERELGALGLAFSHLLEQRQPAPARQAIAGLRQLLARYTAGGDEREAKRAQLVGHALQWMQRLVLERAGEAYGQSDDVRERAAWIALLFAVGSAASEVLVDLFAGATTHDERRALARTLVQLGPAVVPVLRARLRSQGTPARFRRAAVDVLATLGAREALPELRSLARHADVAVQEAAVQAMLALGDDAGAAQFIGTLPNLPPARAARLVRLLANQRPGLPGFVAYLQDVFRAALAGRIHPDLFEAACDAVTRVAAHEDLPVEFEQCLHQLLDPPLKRRLFARAQGVRPLAGPLRAAATRALGAVASNWSRPLLERLAQDSETPVREAAAGALRR